jgi:hypothetical protein
LDSILEILGKSDGSAMIEEIISYPIIALLNDMLHLSASII